MAYCKRTLTLCQAERWSRRHAPGSRAGGASRKIFDDEQNAWRRGRDSNPRYGYPYAAFRVRCFQPLSHLSVAAEGANILSVGGYVSNARRLNKNGLSPR